MKIIENKLPFIYSNNVETYINHSTIIEKRSIYISREENKTFIHISGLDFFYRPTGVLFNFYSDNNSMINNLNFIYLPEINILSLNEILIFIKEILLNYKKGLYKWDYENRCNIYKSNSTEEI